MASVLEPLPVPLARMVSRRFEATGRHQPAVVEFLEDLAASAGQPGAGRRLGDRPRVTFTEMVAAVRSDLASPAEPLELVVLAHDTPDSEPTWPACYLADTLPGRPFAFAVADQGPVAPFTALRLAASYLRDATVRTAAVVVLEQRSVVAARRSPARSPAHDQLVAMVFAPGGEEGTMRVCTEHGVPPESASQVVAGPDVVAAAAGLPTTGRWLELARRRQRSCARGGQAAHCLEVAEYDEATRTLGRAVLEVPATGAGARRVPAPP